MNAQHRPPPDRSRAAIEGAKRALQASHPAAAIPEGSYGEEQVRRAYEVLSEIEESVGQSDGERIYRFGKSARDVFDGMTPEKWSAFEMMVAERMRHDIVAADRRRIVKAGLALGGTAWAGVVWGGDALEWAIGKIPLVKTLIHLWKGSPP